MTANAKPTVLPAELPFLVELYDIDPAHASAQFKVRHLMVSHVRGRLGAVSGKVLIDQLDITRSEVVASIDATQIDTRHPDRDAHLRSSDFLDVESFPTIEFRSTSITRRPGGLDVHGDLTIRGATRPVTLAVELSERVRDPWGNVKRGVWATARIERKEFGVSWNAVMDAGGVVVSDTVDIELELELVRT